MTRYILNVAFLFDREMKVYYDTQVLKQGIMINTICPNYILELE